MAKMGDKTVAFVQKAYEYCCENPSLVPPFIDMAAFKVDVSALELLKSFYNPLTLVVEAIDDSILMSGSEAYQAALMFYGSMKTAAKSKVPNAESIYNNLFDRFSKKIGAKNNVSQPQSGQVKNQ